METKTQKACLSVTLCTCKIVTTKVEELRSAQTKSAAILSKNITWKHRKRQKIKTHLPNRNYQILSQTPDIAKLKPINQFKTSLLDKNPELLPKRCVSLLFFSINL